MTQETRRDLRFSMFVALLLAIACLSVWLSWLANSVVMTPALVTPIVVLLLAVLVSELLVVSMSGGGPAVSLQYPLTVAAIVYFGPLYAAAITAASLIPSLVSPHRPRISIVLGNVGQMVVSVAVGGLVFVGLGGVPLALATSQSGLGASFFAATAVAAVVPILLNAVILAIGFSIQSQGGFFAVLKELAVPSALPSQLVLGFVGVAIAQIVFAVGPSGFALFVAPLLVARQTYQQSVKLREAYADTISSLVAALEAKDVYTKGHSVRVAEYTVMIAEVMGFSPDKVRRIEQGALLHDLGKVGVSRRVLAKEARLTDGEYDEIKRHPDIGAHIVADVPYLADLVPMIAHHHTWYDGRGYGGAPSDEIPLEARILAVADSYDAMTSARPYRGAMNHEDAVLELWRYAGTQFDPAAVAAFEAGYSKAADASADALVGMVALHEA